MPSNCATCYKPNATLVCSKCKNTYYCNVECQVKHWKQHKKNCFNSLINLKIDIDEKHDNAPDIQETYTQYENEFPNKLGPFGVIKCGLSQKHFSSIYCDEKQTGSYQLDQRQLKFDQTIDFNTLLEFIHYVNKSEDMNVDDYGIFGTMSPIYIVTLNTEAKKAANIPSNARYFSWSYPSILPKNTLSNLSNKQITSKWLNDANIILLTVGGYMYFNENKQLLQINTLIPAIDGGLQFSKPKKWDNKFTAELHKNGRFQEITIASLSSKGAKYFCWLFPMEEIQSNQMEKCIFTQHGGFVYLFHEVGDITDQQLVSMDRYFEILSGYEFKKSNRKQQILAEKGIIQNKKQWNLTYIEYKKKELKLLKNK
eukprot:170720_1